jgi:endonuclease YncB( thermonuclease family)
MRALWWVVVLGCLLGSAALHTLAGGVRQSCLVAQLQPASVQRTIDGDTFVLYAVAVPPEERVRVLGVDAVELRTPQGPAAKQFTQDWLARGPFTFDTCKRDSFGRYLAVVTRGTDTLAVDLIRAGLGVPR